MMYNQCKLVRKQSTSKMYNVQSVQVCKELKVPNLIHVCPSPKFSALAMFTILFGNVLNKTLAVDPTLQSIGIFFLP